jgi:hypothetical protein
MGVTRVGAGQTRGLAERPGITTACAAMAANMKASRTPTMIVVTS